MKKRSAIAWIILGAALFVFGGCMSIWFFSQPSFLSIEFIPPEAKVFFTFLSVLGLAILIFGISRLTSSKRQQGALGDPTS